jgi:hypothetical protein
VKGEDGSAAAAIDAGCRDVENREPTMFVNIPSESNGAKELLADRLPGSRLWECAASAGKQPEQKQRERRELG